MAFDANFLALDCGPGGHEEVRMPTKHLPPRSDLGHLKAQASELLDAATCGDPRACQRLREFHPRFDTADDGTIARAHLRWSDALFAIAREYGFASWARLKAHVDSRDGSHRDTPLIERIIDPLLRRAVELMDDGDLVALSTLLDDHPDVTHRRALFEGRNYFRTPALLAFIADNPVRHDGLPPNIVEIARTILSRGMASTRDDLDETLGLVASARVPREAGVQGELIALLVEFGADPEPAMTTALTHGEFDAVRCLVAQGAPMSLRAAAAINEVEHSRVLLTHADERERSMALALSAQHGATDTLRLLLDAGVNPNRFNPIGVHAHSTPLHQAACNGHEGAVSLLLERGARTDLRDTLWNGTPLDWALHEGQGQVAELLKAGMT